VKDKQGFRFGNLQLQPRHYLADFIEVGEEEYSAALSSRLSEDSISWQRRFLVPEENDASLQIHPHILQKGETLVEFEAPGKAPFAELVNEIYAEFQEASPDTGYRGWEFIAGKDGKYHGRISGNAFCRVMELEPEEKEQKLQALSRKENFFSGNGNKGCLPTLIPSAGGLNPISLFTGGGCLNGGCSQMGCGLLSLLALLAGILSLFRSCTKDAVQNSSPRVVHDTVYIKDGMQVKEFVDSTFVNKTDAILLPNVQGQPRQLPRPAPRATTYLARLGQSVYHLPP
jgi:hypothetical protein